MNCLFDRTEYSYCLVNLVSVVENIFLKRVPKNQQLEVVLLTIGSIPKYFLVKFISAKICLDLSLDT